MQTGLAGVKLTMRDHVEAKTTKLSSVSATSVYASIGVERMFKSLSISVDAIVCEIDRSHRHRKHSYGR